MLAVEKLALVADFSTYYSRYWPLYKMTLKNDWRGVEDFISEHPDALTDKIDGHKTIFHLIAMLLVDVESDEGTCLVDKLASIVVPEALARQNRHGSTFLCGKRKSKGHKSSNEV